MNTEARIKYFEDFKNEEPYSYKDIYYQGTMQKLPVYKINLDFVIYNRWNGRIGSLVKSYEHESGAELNASDKKCCEIIEKFLWQSNIHANKATYENLKEQGQKEYGIVTKDGVIIDGNRRVMLLRQKADELKEKPGFFIAVVLNQKLSDNRKEIIRLETAYQMGEDAKVDYGPIEKYLKCKDMIEAGFKVDEIAKTMGVRDGNIEEYLQIMDLMDQYLDNLGYKGIYTRLDKTEDLFINLNKVCRRWKKSSGMVRWNFQDSDISDFRLLLFDFIRYVYNAPKGIESKEIRDALTKNSENSLFAHEKIWKEFSDRHFKDVGTITTNEKSVKELRDENSSRDFNSLAKSRDGLWAKRVDPLIKKNFGLASEALDNLQKREMPLDLLESAFKKLEAIDVDSLAFLNEEKVLIAVDKVRKIADSHKSLILKHRKGSR